MNKYQDTLFDLSGKVVLITGGAGTLGQHYGRTVAEAGAHCIIADLDEKRCQEIAQAITKSTESEALGVSLDVSSPASVKSMVQTIINKFGRIDVLINNAGVSGKFNAKNVAPTLENYPLDEWQKAVDVNITGMFLCAQAVGQQMIKRKSGVIINISSTYGLVSPDQRLYQKDAEPGKVFIKPISYCVTKSAVLNFTRYLSTYYAPHHIRVNTLTPGGVDDGSLDGEFKEKYGERTPLGRMANPDEYNGAILFLCSEASSYMTGANLVVDGGWTAW